MRTLTRRRGVPRPSRRVGDLEVDMESKMEPEMETIYERFERQGYSRREFLRVCGLIVGAMGLHNVPLLAYGDPRPDSGPGTGIVLELARVLQTKPRLPVIWLQFQDCAGCTEAFTRSQSPKTIDLVLDTLAIEYHETLSAAAGIQAEENRQAVMSRYPGQYLLVVEGAIPTARDGAYCTIGGRSALDLLREAAAGAAAIVATGNCAAFGGIPKASPNPTGAKGAWEVITDRTVVNVPGCPAIPEVTTGTIAHFVAFGELPELDELNRPKTFYGHTVHDRCERLPFFRDEKYARSFDDDGAKQGWCLFKLGCKGPTTFNSCSSLKWYQGLSYPVEGHAPRKLDQLMC